MTVTINMSWKMSKQSLWSKCSSIRLAIYLLNRFEDKRKVRYRTIIIHYTFLIQPRFVKQRGYGESIQILLLLLVAVISCTNWSAQLFKNQVGSGSKLHDLFGDMVIFFMTSTLEADQNISNIFSLNLIVIFGES